MNSPDPRTPPDGTSEARAEVHAGHGRERSAFQWGIGLSIVAHILLLALYPVVMERLSPDLREVEREDPVDFERGMEIVLLLETEPAEEEFEDPPEARVEPEVVPEPPPEPDVEVAEPPAPPVIDLPTLPAEPPAVADPDAEPPTVAELLRPRAGDPRLWAPLTAEYLELTDAERAQIMLQSMLRTWNDSMAVARALADRSTDWTYTDEEGRRWGISPGRLHLGDYSVPLPIVFEAPNWIRNDMARRQWINDDIARGAAAHQMRETWAERAQEIRRRMDEERARQRGGGDGGN